ncbi:MAG: hypothetical protein ABWY06_17240 [Pseudomonas sp.]|uniref:hypothetical protein n=1 Tax=Pseudomonas sp. TaxID=306 RepID=UPI003390F4D1
MALTIDSLSNSAYASRLLQRQDQVPASANGLQARPGLDTPSPSERLQANRESAQARLEQRQDLQQSRQERLQEQQAQEQAERLRQQREQAAQAFEDRIGQQRVENYLESRQDNGALDQGPLSPDNLARQRLQLQANQLTYGLSQPSATPRLAAEAVATYRDIQQGPMVQRGLVA